MRVIGQPRERGERSEVMSREGQIGGVRAPDRQGHYSGGTLRFASENAREVSSVPRLRR
jgi:hypothetical protein